MDLPLLDQATRRLLQLPHIMAGVAMTAALAVPTTVAAQSDMSPSPPPMTTEEAKIALPDPEGYRLEISNEGLDAQQRQNL